MARRGDPIDPITVLWKAQQHPALHGTDPAHVLDFLHQAAGSAEHWTEHLYTRSLLTTARTVGREITALTHDPAHAPTTSSPPHAAPWPHSPAYAPNAAHPQTLRLRRSSPPAPRR